MKNLYLIIFEVLRRPRYILSGAAIISVFSLVAALASQAFGGLEPCIMCLYQRAPFALIILEVFLYFALRKRALMKTKFLDIAALADVSLLFLINAGLATYHSGIERKWWGSAVEGCALPDMGDDPQNILENILNAPTARCDEISWADPFFNFTMANYNAIMCAILGLVCTIALILRFKRA